MQTNYHTHTARCQHAAGEDREYIEAAIERGIKVLGFSDHCPWIFPGDYVSGIRMLPSQTDDYCHSLESLRKEYASDIDIKIGFEAEYVPSLMEAQDRFLADYPIDYMILGQHYLGEEPGSVYTGWETDDYQILKKYVDTVIEGMESGRYLYLAHPDLIYYVGSDTALRLSEKERKPGRTQSFGRPAETQLSVRPLPARRAKNREYLYFRH